MGGLCRNTNSSLSDRRAIPQKRAIDETNTDPQQFMQTCMRMFASMAQGNMVPNLGFPDTGASNASGGSSRQRMLMLGNGRASQPSPSEESIESSIHRGQSSEALVLKDTASFDSSPMSFSTPKSAAVVQKEQPLAVADREADDRGGIKGLDAMLANVAQGVATPIVESKPGGKKKVAVAKSVSKTKGAVAKAVSVSIDSFPITKPPPMPDITKDRPVFILGKAKVYTSLASKAWRVKPDWKVYANDKTFPWTGSPKKVWQAVIDYCKNPNIPKTWKKIPSK